VKPWGFYLIGTVLIKVEFLEQLKIVVFKVATIFRGLGGQMGLLVHEAAQNQIFWR